MEQRISLPFDHCISSISLKLLRTNTLNLFTVGQRYSLYGGECAPGLTALTGRSMLYVYRCNQKGGIDVIVYRPCTEREFTAHME